jgi:hypothetical protein
MELGDILLGAFVLFSVVNTWVAFWFFNRSRAKPHRFAHLDHETMETYSHLRLAKLQEELLGQTMKFLNT